jgi:hypothetical protein
LVAAPSTTNYHWHRHFPLKLKGEAAEDGQSMTEDFDAPRFVSEHRWHLRNDVRRAETLASAWHRS